MAQKLYNLSKIILAKSIKRFGLGLPKQSSSYQMGMGQNMASPCFSRHDSPFFYSVFLPYLSGMGRHNDKQGRPFLYIIYRLSTNHNSREQNQH